MSVKVFISYKFQDSKRNDWVQKLYLDLRRAGIDAALYDYEPVLGESFSAYMSHWLCEYDYVLFVITPMSVKAVEQGRGALSFELQLAAVRAGREGSRMIPIVREGIRTSAYLSDHRYLDFRNNAQYELSFDFMLKLFTGKAESLTFGEHSLLKGKDALAHAGDFTRIAQEEFNSKNYAGALHNLEIAIHLDPSDISGWGLLGRSLTNLGRFDEAILPLSRAIDYDHLQANQRLYLKCRSLANYFSGEYWQAISDADKILESRPGEREARRLRATAWTVLDHLQEALADIDCSLEGGSYLCGQAIKSLILHKMGEAGSSSTALAVCSRLEPGDGVDFYCLALAYANSEFIASSFGLLEKSIQFDPKCLPRAKVDPLFAEIRQDPRFERVISMVH